MLGLGVALAAALAVAAVATATLALEANLSVVRTTLSAHRPAELLGAFQTTHLLPGVEIKGFDLIWAKSTMQYLYWQVTGNNHLRPSL